MMRLPYIALAVLMAGCTVYEPARLAPAVNLSPEQLSIRELDAGLLVDFGLEVAVNESDSLAAVEILPGVRVVAVAANGPADSAGIQAGDVILTIDGMETNSPDAVLAIQRRPYRDAPHAFTLRRDTTVLAASVSGREIAANAGPEALYRVDPVATRAGYRTELVAVAGGPDRAGARVVALFPGSPCRRPASLRGNGFSHSMARVLVRPRNSSTDCCAIMNSAASRYSMSGMAARCAGPKSNCGTRAGA